jgi:hypothetical protein
MCIEIRVLTGGKGKRKKTVRENTLFKAKPCFGRDSSTLEKVVT